MDLYDEADAAMEAHHADQLAIQQDIRDVIERASRILDDDDVNLLCWATGTDPRLVDVKRSQR